MAGLTLGSVDLMGAGFNVYALGTDSGTNWGSPGPIETQLQSFLQDGAIVITQGFENREQFVAVEITGNDLLSVAQAEAALFLELGKRNTLTYTPPGGVAPPTVFEVMTSSLEPLPDDLVEAMNSRRLYMIRLVSLPWSRSVSEVVVAAVGTGATPAAATITSVDDCTATTGWARGGAATTGPTVVTGAVTVGFTATLPDGITISASADRSGLSANMATTRYLRVTASQIQSGFLAAGGFTFLVNGSVKAPVATAGGAYYLDCVGMTVTSLSVVGKWIGRGYTGGTATVRVDDVSRTDQIPAIGTLRQMQRTIAISGSAPTQATLAIEHLTQSLGDVMAYVYKNDNASYSPPLRQYRVAGGAVTTDATLVSGARETLATSVGFDIPYSALPAGNYEILIRCAATTTTAVQTVNYATDSRYLGGAVITSSGTPTSISTTLGVQKIYSLGRTSLPPTNLPSNSGMILRVTISSPTGANVTLDEVWLFNLTIGRLTRFATDSTNSPSPGTTATNRAWISSPTVSTGGLPSLLIGVADDQSDAIRPPSVSAWMPPQFTPPSVGLFTVTTFAVNAAASARYFPRWHTNAAS